MCGQCDKLQEQITYQRQVLQELILGMEIMTTNARVLVHLTEPTDKSEGESA